MPRIKTANGTTKPNGAGDQDEDLDDEDLDDAADSDEDEDDDEDEQDEDDADEDEDDDDAEDGAFDEAAFMQRVESRIDKRVTGLMNKLEKRLNALGVQKQTPASQKKQTPASTATVTADARMARLAYREAIGDDGFKFRGADERELANDLAKGLIAAAIAEGEDDEDEIGASVAEKVRDRIVKARQSQAARTKASLRRQGLLPADTKGGQGGTEGKGKTLSARSAVKQGAARAAARYPKQTS